ncbi:hypothetical protein EZV62_026594 [Acer yangbiense]|uniref:Pectinesterase n=1 Tax=Acer yangbiense TaxID=1000413 RepID=A0A5C7GRY3_9ROSI|nr:hypothetical protein EZV62_026594 [Acer yangbiense]
MSSFIFFAILHFVMLTVSAQRPNATVALDGTGDYLSIAEAVGHIPNNSDSLFYIYIKAGVYNENVFIGGEKRNIVMSGDGIGKTIIVSSLSNSSGSGIGVSAALNIESEFFLAKDMSILNSAGPEGGQAVALRTSGNHIACLRCSIEGFQDTLYAHQGKSQFFYNCDIYGTIDFIFGDAAVIIQNSTIHVRRPLHGHIVPTPDLRSQSDVKTYLGRPWKKFSQTIIMQSYLDTFIDHEGWMKFDESSDVTTLHYVEFRNSGPGSSTGGRVKWPGYHVLNNPKDVQNFTVEKFINGSEWLPKLDVPYSSGLVST